MCNIYTLHDSDLWYYIPLREQLIIIFFLIKLYTLYWWELFFLHVATEGSKEFKGSGSLDDAWDNDYADSSTSKYQKLSSELESHLTIVLKKSYKEDFIGVEVNNFRKGSIKFDFTVYLKATTSVDEDTLKDVIEKGEGSSNFTILVVSVEQVAGPKPTTSTTEKPESGPEKWIIVLIVTSAVIVILVIALLVVVVSL